MQRPPKAEQSDALICGVCRKYLHIPYTLPCMHSYCLEPCLIAGPNQTDVRCFRCGKVYPRKLAVHNEDLERLVTQRFVEERRSLVTTCNACQHPAPVLRSCRHCQLRVCSSCLDSHYAKVVASVTRSIYALSNEKENLVNKRNQLKASSCGQGSRLKDAIEEATLELKEACDKSLDISMANLIAFFMVYLDELVALKEAAILERARIIKSARQGQLLSQMAIADLLDLRGELKLIGVRAGSVYNKVDKCKEKPKLRVEHSLTGVLETLSLIATTNQEDDDPESSCQDEKSEAGGETNSAATGKQVFVGGVSRKVDHVKLRNYFSRYGPVKNSFVSHSKGFGCVTFESEASVLKAISERFQLIDDTKVEVKEYKRTHSDVKTEPSKNAAPSAHPWEPEKVFIGGILPSITKASLQSSLSQLGPVKKLDLVPQRRFGVVVFTDPQTTSLAIETHWLFVDGKKVELLPFVPDKAARIALAKSGSKSTETPNLLSLKSPSSPSVASLSTPAPSLEAQTRVFVGGISWKTTATSLTSALSEFGPVQRVDIFPNRGFAIVFFKQPKTAHIAISVHWYMVDGKIVELRPFVPGNKSVEPTGQANLSRVGSTSSVKDTPGLLDDQPLEDTTSRTLYVNGLNKSISETILEAYFSQYGDVKKCLITGQLGCLVFGGSRDLQNALSAQPHDLDGQRLVLIPASSKKHRNSNSSVTHASAVSSMINARKLLIRGIGEGTTYAILRNYFLNYGPVDCASVTDTEAWVVFKNAETANLVLATQPHFIRGREIILSKPNEGDSALLCPPTPPVVTGGTSTVASAPSLGPPFDLIERASSPRRVESSNALSSTKAKVSNSAPRKQL